MDRLESDGLVTRAPDPNDKRSRLAIITDAGRKAHVSGSDILQTTEHELFGALTDHESAQLHALLSKVAGEKPS